MSRLKKLPPHEKLSVMVKYLREVDKKIKDGHEIPEDLLTAYVVIEDLLMELQEEFRTTCPALADDMDYIFPFMADLREQIELHLNLQSEYKRPNFGDD